MLTSGGCTAIQQLVLRIYIGVFGAAAAAALAALTISTSALSERNRKLRALDVAVRTGLLALGAVPTAVVLARALQCRGPRIEALPLQTPSLWPDVEPL